MDSIEKAVRDAFGVLRAPAAPQVSRDTDDDARSERAPVRRPSARVTRAPIARDSYDRVKRTHPDVGRYADYKLADGEVVTVRIASIAGMSGMATVQRVDTRETLSVEACDLEDRRDVA